MVSLSTYVTALHRAQWELAGVGPPIHSPDLYEWMERRVRVYSPESMPLEDPEELLKREGFGLKYKQGLSCGYCMDDLIVASMRKDRRERFLILHHERVHAWSRKLGYELNDADAWLATAVFLLPPWLRPEAPTLLMWQQLPGWYLVCADLIPEG